MEHPVEHMFRRTLTDLGSALSPHSFSIAALEIGKSESLGRHQGRKVSCTLGVARQRLTDSSSPPAH